MIVMRDTDFEGFLLSIENHGCYTVCDLVHQIDINNISPLKVSVDRRYVINHESYESRTLKRQRFVREEVRRLSLLSNFLNRY